MSTEHHELSELLASVFTPTDAEMTVLRDRLSAGAEDSSLLDVAFRTMDTPIGQLLLAATPLGLIRVAFESEDLDLVLDELATKVSPRLLESPRRLEDCVRQLGEYFSGQRRRFEVPLDLSLSSGFRRTVLTHLPEIDYGHTESYQEVASAVDNPKAVRAVGTACATNPLPLVIPCHRVIRSDGQFGAYRGGSAAKAQLLRLESAA